ncbi:phosphoglycerol transferase [Oceaniferula spumae]|uniref:Phosphoglycerol transferase n=1 Tax=Oceaniferula spumae TaxID=2979115 RepID=A0AAT9FR59_9BACT
MTAPVLPRKGWNAFVHHLARDAKLWLWVAFLLFVARALLIWLNRFSLADETGFTTFATAFFVGFRFDMPVATVFTLPSFLAACLGILIPMNKVISALRAISTYFFTISWVLITTITLGYFKQYHNQFDAHLLGVVYDDFGAIVMTVWKSYPVILGSIVMIIIGFVLIYIGRRWIKAPFPILAAPKAPSHFLSKVGVTLLLLVLLAVGIRGSVGSRPMQKKDAARTMDSVLNRCVINPITSLAYAIKSHRELMRGDGLERYLKKGNILDACKDFSGRQDIHHLDDAFLRSAEGHRGKKPNHIFLLVMESYDGWTMLPKHSEWNISNELKKLGKEGVYIEQFLPGSRSTMTSLATIISGMADAGVITNERSSPLDPAYATALAMQMKQLGYETHFWYAGYGSWQRIETFCHEQGFEFTHMGAEMGPGEGINEWGVTDEHLFSYIESKFNPEKPSFNIVLTSTNHPPYDLDLKKAGCPLTSVPAPYQAAYERGTATVNMLGHHWYSDKWMGHFVRNITSKTPGCLFAITGDHWGRIYPGPRPESYERAIVPLVLYGPDVLPKDIDGKSLRGSHYDLGATLIEMAADRGHKYHAIGRNILETRPDDIAISRLWLMGKDFIVSTSDGAQLRTLDGQPLDNEPNALTKARRTYKLMHGLSWWRLRKGNDLPDDD